MIPHLIPLVSAFITPDICETIFYPLFSLYFIGTIPIAAKFLLR